MSKRSQAAKPKDPRWRRLRAGSSAEDGTILRVQVSDGDERFGYFHLWKGLAIAYRYLSDRDLETTDIVELPIAFRVSAGQSVFSYRPWTGRSWIVDSAAPRPEARLSIDFGRPEDGLIMRWSDKGGDLEAVPVPPEAQRGLLRNVIVMPEDLVDRLVAVVHDRPWPEDPIRRAYLFCEPIPAPTQAPLPHGPLSPFDLKSGSHEFFDRLLEPGSRELEVLKEALEDVADSSSGAYLETDLDAAALAAAGLVAAKSGNLDVAAAGMTSTAREAAGGIRLTVTKDLAVLALRALERAVAGPGELAGTLRDHPDRSVLAQRIDAIRRALLDTAGLESSAK